MKKYPAHFFDFLNEEKKCSKNRIDKKFWKNQVKNYSSFFA